MHKMLFFNSTIMGTLITTSSYSWLMMWLGMEINLLSIIPTFMGKKNIYPSESAIKYFINQSLASTIFIMSILILESPLNQANYLTSVIYMSIYSSIFLKLGMAPLHSWLPEVMEGLDWPSSLMILTWQKIAPMIIMMMIMKPSMFMFLFMVLSSITGGVLGINQTSMRKIMAYSSINHMAWMTMSMMSFSKIWLIYFIIYSTTNVFLIIMFMSLKIYFINQIKSLKLKKISLLIYMMNFFSLGGLPPFIGFMPKWLTILFTVKLYNFLVPSMLVILTLISLYMYLRLTFSSMMMKTYMPKINSKFKINFSLVFFNTTFLMSMMPSNLVF